MPELVSVATAVPPHCVEAADVKAEIAARVPDDLRARLWEIVDSTRVHRRYTVAPVDELLRLGTIQERNDAYTRHALALGETVAREALSGARVAPESMAALVAVSCTGFMLPSLDAHLINRLGLPPTLRRVPITELGCSAGVGGISLAAALLANSPDRAALVTSVELSSLGLQVAEPSMTDMVANLLFGDGAAAAVVASRTEGRGPEILGSHTMLWPDSTGTLGMRLTDTGFRLVLSTELPKLVRRELPRAMEDFFVRHHLGWDDLSFCAIHPGGPKVLETVAESLHLSDRVLRPSWETWERYGNLSSANIFFVLRTMQELAPPSPGDLGIMMAFGPGVTCEVILLRANGWLSGATC